jgi:hypothetical protein
MQNKGMGDLSPPDPMLFANLRIFITYALRSKDPKFGHSKIMMSNKLSKHKIYNINYGKYFN